MKNIIAFIVLASFLSCTTTKDIYLFTSFREPATDGLYLATSIDGYNWQDLRGPYLKPEIGKSKIMRDPSIVRAKDNVYHMVWTTEWRGGTGFGYANSTDLIHWSKQKYIPVMAQEPDVVNVWAPEIFYDDIKDEYIIIWASTIPYLYEKGEEDEKNNHRMYYVTTKDFISFSNAKLFLEPGFSAIDCVIVKRDIKDYALIIKDNTRPNRNLKMGFGSSPLGPFKNISVPFTDFLSEGPTILKKEDSWLIYYDNYGAKNYKAKSTTDFITFKDVTEQIRLPEGHKHGTITTISKKVLKNLVQNSKTK